MPSCWTAPTSTPEKMSHSTCNRHANGRWADSSLPSYWGENLELGGAGHIHEPPSSYPGRGSLTKTDEAKDIGLNVHENASALISCTLRTSTFMEILSRLKPRPQIFKAPPQASPLQRLLFTQCGKACTLVSWSSRTLTFMEVSRLCGDDSHASKSSESPHLTLFTFGEEILPISTVHCPLV